MVKFLGLLDPLSLGLSQFHEDETTMNIATPFGLGCLAHQIPLMSLGSHLIYKDVENILKVQCCA